jgi:MFS family permease
VTTTASKTLFADRNFRLYTVASVVSWLSFFVQTLAVIWLAWDLAHSPAWLGIITFLDAVPYFIFGPWGSVFADRHDRYLAHKAASFRPWPRCKPLRYLRVAQWFAPCPC